MKKTLLFMALIATVLNSFAQVAINTDGSSANPSAMLDIKSDTAGILIPRMTAAQRDAISNPAQGLLVFVSDDSTFCYYHNSSWIELSSGENAWQVSGDTVFTVWKKRVGIGTSSPGARLDVAGHIWTTNTGHSVFIGKDAGKNDVWGYTNYNTIIGEEAGYSNIEGWGNVAVGFFSLQSNMNSMNTALGGWTLRYNNYGVGNTATGYQALTYNTQGIYNTANGLGALASNTTGNCNVAIGERALSKNTERSFLVAVGDSALYHNGEYTTLIYQAAYNTALGHKALFANNKGYRNTAVGYKTLSSNTQGFDNTALGYAPLSLITTGYSNIAIGSYAGRYMSDSITANDQCIKSVFLGTNTKSYESNDTNEVVIGYHAIGNGSNSVTLGNENVNKTILRGRVGIGTNTPTALLDVKGSFRLEDGHQALGNILITDDEGFASWANGDTISAGGWTVSGNYVYNLGDSVGIGTASPGATLEVSGHIFQSGTGQSIFLGDSTGIHDDLSDNRNVFLGYKAGFKNTTGYSNVAIGPQSLHNGYVVYNNIAIGDSVLYYNNGNNVWQAKSGKYNTAIGSKAAVYNLGGYLNTVVGYKAFYKNIYGNNNTSLGAYSLSSNTYGDDNTAIGYYALRYNTLGNNNTAIGFAALNYDTTGSNNTAIGYKALFYNKQGNDNTAIGKYALFSNAKSSNVAIGNSALYHGYAAYRSIAIGTNAMHYIPSAPLDSVRNVAIGYDALYGQSYLGYSSSGNMNTAIGYKTMQYNLAGSGNTAIGDSSIASNTNGNNNTAFGCNSLTSNTTGNSNVAIGINSLFKNSEISNLVAIGDSSLYNNGDGASGLYEATENSAFGSKALYANTTGYYNTALGYKSLQANITGSSNTAAGTLALYTNTSGSYNTSTGNLSLYSNNTGKKNTATGYGSLYSNNSGENNTAIGYNAGRSSTASGNVFIGYQAGYSETGSDKLYIANSNTSTPLIGGDFNVGRVDINGTIKITGGSPSSGKILSSDAVGNATWVDGSTVNGGGWTISGTMLYSLYDYVGIGTSSPGAKLDVAGHIWQTSTGYSVFLGENAGDSDDLTDNNNVLIGYNAGTANTSGNDNTALGYEAMKAVTDGRWNTALGHLAYQTGNYSNSTALGDGVSITASSQVRIGHNVTSIGGPQNWTNTSDGRFKTDVTENVPGLAFIEQLRPVTYYLDVEKLDDYTGVSAEYRNDPLAKQAASIASSQLRTGFIAQEVEKAAQSVGYNFSGVDAPKNSSDVYGLRYAEFVVPLVKAVQEQQQTIETQNQQMELLKKDNAELKARLDRLEKLVEKAN